MKNVSLKSSTGFSLLEIIIVLAIVGTLTAIILTSVTSSQSKAQIKETGVKAGQIFSALLNYQVDTGSFPSTSQGLEALVKNPGVSGWIEPYVKNEDQLKDSWNHFFRYELADGNPVLISNGKDGQKGTKDDLRYEDGKLVTNSDNQ